MYRVSKKGNYLLVVNTVTGEEMEGLAKDVMIHRDYDVSTSWRFKGLNGNITDAIPEDQLLDGDNADALFVDFDTWRASNTAGAGSENGLTDSELRATPLHVIVDNVSTATVESLLTDIKTQATAINSNTDALESKVDQVKSEITATGTVNHADLVNIFNQVTAINGNTDGLEGFEDGIEAALASILAKIVAAPATSAKQDTTNASLASIDAKLTEDVASTTPANVNVTTSASTLAASNASRKNIILHNSGLNTIYVKYGSAATVSDYSFPILPGQTMSEEKNYTGIITAITSAGSSDVKVTEI